MRDKAQRLAHLLLGGLAAVEVLVDGVDRAFKLGLGELGLLRGHGQRLDHIAAARPDHLLIGEERRQRAAEHFRPFPVNPLVDSHAGFDSADFIIDFADNAENETRFTWQLTFPKFTNRPTGNCAALRYARS